MNANYLIILLNYNNWQDTSECVLSLINSGTASSNILIIENCSTDNSREKLSEEIPAIKVIHSNKNLGFTGGNNVGLKYALENNYDYAIVLNNDTIVESKDSIKNLIDEMDQNPDVTLGTGRIFYYPEKDKVWYDGGTVIKWRAAEKHFNFRKNINEIKLNNELRNIDFISGCYMCIRIRDLPKLGYMDEKFFIYLDDLEYSSRASKYRMKMLYVPNSVIYHKARGEGKHTPKLIYYSIRNRRLLINLHFGFITKFYFEVVLIIKRIMWFTKNRKYFHILNQAIKDYNRNYLGQAPDFIK
jgi:GT2 family glycosyltransferase